MKLRNPVRLAIFLSLSPATGVAVAADSASMAAPAEPSYRNYEKFELTPAEEKAVVRVTSANCPRRARGPKFQARCRAKLLVRSEARLKASYKLTEARLPESARVNLREQEESWMTSRYGECVWLSEDIEANPRAQADVEIEYYDCALLELGRRTAWLDLYK